MNIRYCERLAEAGIEPSVGTLGNIYENARAEMINGLYKARIIDRCGPRRTFEAIAIATLEWVDMLNHRRLFRALRGHATC